MRRLVAPTSLRLQLTHCSQIRPQCSIHTPSRPNTVPIPISQPQFPHVQSPTTKQCPPQQASPRVLLRPASLRMLVRHQHPPPTSTGGQPASAFSRWRSGLDMSNVLTLGALGLFCAAFGFEQYARAEASQHRNWQPTKFVRDNLVLSLRNIREGRWWTLITYSFTHLATMHLFFNSIALLSSGPHIVTAFGPSVFAIAWVGSALSCAGAGLWWDSRLGRESDHVGASGVVFGFLTTIAFLSPRSQVQVFPIMFPLPMYGVMLGTAGLTALCLGNSWFPSIGHAGHLGGMGFGALYYLAYLKRRLPFRRF